MCGGVRKKATSKFFMLDSTEVFAYNVLLHEEPNFFNPSGYKLTKKYMIVEGGRESAILDYYQGMERLTLLPDQLKRGDTFKEGVMMDMLVKFPNSRAMLMILNNERKRFSMDRLGEALSLFDSPELIGHPLYKELVAYREAVMKTSVGQVVPDFSLPSMKRSRFVLSGGNTCCWILGLHGVVLVSGRCPTCIRLMIYCMIRGSRLFRFRRIGRNPTGERL